MNSAIHVINNVSSSLTIVQVIFYHPHPSLSYYQFSVPILLALPMGFTRAPGSMLYFYLFGVLCQHCTGHIMTGSWKGRGN